MNVRHLPAAMLIATVAASALPLDARAADAPPVAETAPPGARSLPQAVESGYVEVNGVNYHYQVQGRGEPVLLLHGGLFNTEMFGPMLTELASHRQVIGVDLHGHGRTALGERTIDPLDIGDDLAVLVKRLGHERIDVMGYSFGGAVALRLAMQHPQRVRRLVLVSTVYATDGFYPEMLPMQAQVGAALADAMKPTPLYQSYAAIAPRPQDFPRLLDQMGAWMRKSYDWSDEVRKLAMPVMLVYGDSDMMRPEHEIRFYQLLGGGLKDAGWMREHMSGNRLAVLPNLTHYEIGASPQLVAATLPFLDGKTQPAAR